MKIDAVVFLLPEGVTRIDSSTVEPYFFLITISNMCFAKGFNKVSNKWYLWCKEPFSCISLFFVHCITFWFTATYFATEWV